MKNCGCFECYAIDVELKRCEQIQKDKASNDADYLKQSAEISRLREALGVAREALKNQECFHVGSFTCKSCHVSGALSRISAILGEKK